MYGLPVTGFFLTEQSLLNKELIESPVTQLSGIPSKKIVPFLSAIMFEQ